MVLDRVAAMDVPHTIVAGDLNERPGGRSFTRLTKELQDGWAASPWGGEYTSTPTDPHQRIDAILATEGVEFLGCGVPTDLDPMDLRTATDHLPVLAAVRIPAT